MEKETFRENICRGLQNLIEIDKYLENKKTHEKSLIINEQRIQYIKKINSEYFIVFVDENNSDIYDI